MFLACKVCFREFRAKRADARLCSLKCRKRLSRSNKDVTDNQKKRPVMSQINVTDKESDLIVEPEYEPVID